MTDIARLIPRRKPLVHTFGMSTQVRKISQADKDAAKRLKAIWDRKAKELNLTQQKAAEAFGRTQGLIGQYLNCHTALGPVATLKFARLLRVSPQEIRPDFGYGTIVPGELPPDVIEIAIKLASVPESVRRDAIGFLNITLSGSGYIDFITRIDEKNNERA